jgi:hypothetical protein
MAMLIITFCTIQRIKILMIMDTISLPFEPSNIEHHQIVENLQPDTLYYWKIVTIGTEGINSETIMQQFKTND